MKTLSAYRRLSPTLILAALLWAPVVAPESSAEEQEGDSESLLGVVAGVIPNDRLDELGLSLGVLIRSVKVESPAEQAGLRSGDILVSLDREDIYSPGRLEWLMRKIETPTNLSAKFYRQGRPYSTKIRLEQSRPKSRSPLEALALFQDLMTSVWARSYLGMVIYTMPSGLRRELGAEPDVGVFVLDVDSDGPASAAGIRPGDVISRIGEETVRRSADVYRALASFDPGDRIEIEIMRSRTPRQVIVTLGKPRRGGATTRIPPSLLNPWFWLQGQL